MLCRLTAYTAFFAMFFLFPALGNGAEADEESADAHVAVAVPRNAPADLAREVARDEADDEDASDDEEAKDEQDDSVNWFKARKAEMEKKLFKTSVRGEYNPQAAATYMVTSKESSGLSHEAIRAVYREHKTQLQYCYSREVARRPSLKGKITFSCTIDADGQVARVRVMEDTLKSASLRQCLESRISSWEFPRPSSGSGAEIVLPTLFW